MMKRRGSGTTRGESRGKKMDKKRGRTRVIGRRESGGVFLRAATTSQKEVMSRVHNLPKQHLDSFIFLGDETSQILQPPVQLKNLSLNSNPEQDNNMEKFSIITLTAEILNFQLFFFCFKIKNMPLL